MSDLAQQQHSNQNQSHLRVYTLLSHLADAARRYGPDALQAADVLANTELGHKLEGYLIAKAEASGLPPEFVTHAGDEARALLAKVAAWQPAPAAA